MTRPAYVAGEPRPWRPNDALWADRQHFVRYETVVLCANCSGRGCELCAEPEPKPGRWQRFGARLTRKER